MRVRAHMLADERPESARQREEYSRRRGARRVRGFEPAGNSSRMRGQAIGNRKWNRKHFGDIIKNMSEYIFNQGKKRRTGFTTGICAAAAARAAAILLLSGREPAEVELAWRENGFDGTGASGARHRAAFAVEDAQRLEGAARCGVRKDAGDDVDVTDGLLIRAEVRLIPGEEISAASRADGTDDRAPDRAPARAPMMDRAGAEPDGGTAAAFPEVRIRGGEGIGRVTMAGLDQPVGEAAINSGPRRMIREAVLGAWEEYADFPEARRRGETNPHRLEVTVSAPGGEALAARTFNPVLGIEGGISILGTTGIVEPMSGAAVAETVRAEVRVRTEEADHLLLVPGNTGAVYAKEALGIAPERIVQCSNYVGAAVDEACGRGVRKLLLVGALGKFVKLAGGIFNTHSHESDARMDILMRCALRAGASEDTLRRMDGCVTTDAALEALSEAGLQDAVLEIVCRRALYYLRRRCGGAEAAPETALVLLAGNGRPLAASSEAMRMAEEFRAVLRND